MRSWFYYQESLRLYRTTVSEFPHLNDKLLIFANSISMWPMPAAGSPRRPIEWQPARRLFMCMDAMLGRRAHDRRPQAGVSGRLRQSEFTQSRAENL